jgi:hypothetical protein
MITKSRRKTQVTSHNSKALYKVDPCYYLDFQGESKKLGSKFKVTNAFVTKNHYLVNKQIPTGMDIADV